MKKLDTNEFILRANNKHSGKYSYSDVNYKNSSIKVSITCPIHGIFKQTPNSHLRGHGCSTCANNNPKNNKQFISEAIRVHKNHYDYSNVSYENAKTNIKIICPKHGEFRQTPNSHLSGMGCRACGYISVSNKNSSNSSEFIRRARLIHIDKYDYNEVNYKNAKTNVKIICPEHGEFVQTPDSHLRGHGCSTCANDRIRRKLTKDTKQFISEAINVHGDKYEYGSVEYEHTNIGVRIICSEHGLFNQTPMKHLQGQGCPICRESKLEKLVRSKLEADNIQFIPQYGRLGTAHYLSGQTIDFYLPEYNIGIECQGIQHFEPVDFGNRGHTHTNRSFIKIVYNDIKKNNLCSDMGIKLLYYTNHDIEEYFTELITNINE